MQWPGMGEAAGEEKMSVSERFERAK